MARCAWEQGGRRVVVVLVLVVLVVVVLVVVSASLSQYLRLAAARAALYTEGDN